MSDVWVCVVAREDAEEPVELQADADGTLSLATVRAQFPGTTGLKFRHPESGALRGVRCVDGALSAPPGGWGAAWYVCVQPEEGESKEGAAKSKQGER